MCKFASFVLTKDQEFYCENGDSHSDIISQNSLHEWGSRGPNIVKVEISPTDKIKSWPSFKEWNFRIDQDVLPSWADIETCEKRTRAALSRRAKNGFEIVYANECTALTELKADAAEYVDVRGCTATRSAARFETSGSTRWSSGARCAEGRNYLFDPAPVSHLDVTVEAPAAELIGRLRPSEAALRSEVHQVPAIERRALKGQHAAGAAIEFEIAAAAAALVDLEADLSLLLAGGLTTAGRSWPALPGPGIAPQPGLAGRKRCVPHWGTIPLTPSALYSCSR
jgi:hypothetical protein